MSDRPPISILVPDVSSNILGAALAIARHLGGPGAVQIVGPDLGGGVNPMYRGAYPFTVVPAPRLYRFPEHLADCRRLAGAATGGTIIAMKAYADTVPVALELKRTRNARVLVYLDEWDGALFARRPAFDRLMQRVRHAHHPMEDAHFPRIERRLAECDHVVSTTRFLQRRFGGSIIPFGVDTDQFAPPADSVVEELRRTLGLENMKLIVFGGVVRPHKGVEQILDALVSLGRSDVRLVIVGPANEHVEALRRRPDYARHLVALGPKPRAEMPLHLALADLAVLPLQDDLLAQSQMPCKVFEAMALAKPVVASDVSDLREVLEDCGRVVPAGDTAALAAAIDALLAAPDLARQLGLAGRRRCIERYSADVARRLWRELAAA